jgi:uncharacterized BrkB/YihY/UPF0761 family membrane protein
MDTLGWSLLGLGIWIAVSLAIPLFATLISKPVDRDEAHWYVGLAWLWPILVPFLIISLPFWGITEYANWLPTREDGKSPDGRPLEGRVVE